MNCNRIAEFEQSQLTLGELISKIEVLDVAWDDGNPKDVYFDFATAIPTTLDSWRGSYGELALGFGHSGYDTNGHFNRTTSSDLLKELKQAIGKQYEGWKGGSYTMSKETPLWVANPGYVDSTAIVGVIDIGCAIVLLTAYCEF